MKENRLQLRIDPRLKERASRVARRRHTTVSALITQFLQQLVETDLIEQRVASSTGDVEQV
jgi:antitoxin component of RelBE/YafQ-DinJ toxin-antitoxin module